jgi:hypothetical protein
MQRISILIITFLLVQGVFGQNQRLLFFSDSLYAQGVELYHAGKYEDAISMFEKSKSIDSEELDSLDLRVAYVKQWLASCHFNPSFTHFSSHSLLYQGICEDAF